MNATALAQPSPGRDVFRNPADYVGKTVTVCGDLDVANLREIGSETRSNYGRGLNVINRTETLVRPQGDYCLTGPISYVGCETDPEIICNDAVWDYAIEIVRWRRLDPNSRIR
jgi:hypothetical protein